MPCPSSTLPTAIDTVPSASILMRCGSFSGLFTSSPHDGAHHAVVRAAAAKVLVQRFPDLPLARRSVAGEERGGGNDDAAHAVAALGGLLGDQRFLHPLVHALDGRHRFADDEGNRQVARCERLAVDQDEARAALAAAAAEARADQAEVVAKDVEERRALARLHFDRLAVDGELHFFAWIAFQTRCGVAGMSRWSICKASRIAFMTTGGAPTQPASPTPFTPSGLVFAGTSMKSMS